MTKPLPFCFFPILFSFLSLAHSLNESEALLKLKTSFANSDALQSWVPDTVPCSEKAKAKWVGVFCFNGIVTGLRLAGMELSGDIDIDALIQIRGLRTISLMNNGFAGTLPAFNRLGALKGMYLSGNKFSGEIPGDYFYKMGSLKKISLANNQFTGKIPDSFGHLQHLVELHLEENQFVGNIPTLKQPSLKSFNVSFNKLEGKVPGSLLRFNESSFAGNDDLCGENLMKKCVKPAQKALSMPSSTGLVGNPNSATNAKKNHCKQILAGVITLGVLFLCIMLFLIVRLRHRRQGNVDAFLKENADNRLAEVPVNLPRSAEDEASVAQVGKRETDSAGKGSHRRGASGGKIPELIFLNTEKGTFGLVDLMKAPAEVLGNGTLGSSYKAMMPNGMAITVKRLREMNATSRDVFDAHIKSLGELKHCNILTPLAYHYRKDEKLFVFEYIHKGSLLYLLHGDHGPAHIVLEWPVRLKIIQGIARGVGHLHTQLASLDLPHGNLKSSNILLCPNNEPLLMDFGYSPLVNVLHRKEALFAYNVPEATNLHQISPKSDVYCLGIIIIEILTRKYPSQYLNNNKGGMDVVQWALSAISKGSESELLDPEISTSQDSVFEMEQLLHIAAACIDSNPETRLQMSDVVSRIEALQTGKHGGAIQMLPSFRDGYADVPGSHVPGSN